MRKSRVHIRLSGRTYAKLCEAAATPGSTKAQIIEDALTAWFDPQAAAGIEELLLRRLDAFDQRQASIERDVAISFETLAHYVQYWLSRTEPLPDEERAAAQILGKRRYDYFMEQVARKVAGRTD